MPQLTLYSTDGCHLCERAESLLEEVARSEPLDWRVVDIADSEELTEHYGIRIPVIELKGADYDLGWPFTAEELRYYLRQFEPDPTN